MLTSRKRSDNRVSGSLSSSHLQYKPETDIDVYFIIYILEKRDGCETNEQYSNTGIFHNCFDIVIKNRNVIFSTVKKWFMFLWWMFGLSVYC